MIHAPKTLGVLFIDGILYDSGNAKWPFSLSKIQLNTGGWVRQENSEHACDAFYADIDLGFFAVQQMPLATGTIHENSVPNAAANNNLLLKPWLA